MLELWAYLQTHTHPSDEAAAWRGNKIWGMRGSGICPADAKLDGRPSQLTLRKAVPGQQPTELSTQEGRFHSQKCIAHKAYRERGGEMGLCRKPDGCLQVERGLYKDDTEQHDTSASFMKLFIQQVFHYDFAKMIK